MMYKLFKGLLAAMLFAAMSLPAWAADHPAQTLVEESVNELIHLMDTEGERIKNDPAYRKAKIDEIIVPNLDFRAMTFLAVGKSWRKASKTQREQLVTEFKTLLLNLYTRSIDEYREGTISFEPFREGSRKDRAEVSSTFSMPGGGKTPVIYKLRSDKQGENWAISDIEVNGQSLIINFRAGFAAEIEKNGIDGLIQAMKEKNGSQ